MLVGIYIYKDVEVLDFAGPFEVFSTASRLMREPENTRLKVCLIAENVEGATTSFAVPILARGGFPVLSQFTISKHPPLDVLIIPGGIHNEEMKKARVLAWIRETAATVRFTASVCTGAFILAASGVLKSGQQVTTHWEDKEDLEQSFPGLKINKDIHQRWVHDGSVVTSGGISAGIDMSLYLVSILQDIDLANRTARQMEFVWTRNHQK